MNFCIITATTDERIGVLENAILSVKSQKYKNHTHVVCGDGKCLKSKELCEKYGIEYVEIVSKHGCWGYACRNYVLETDYAARSDMLMFLDDDNIIFPNCLSEIINFSADYVSFNIAFVKKISRKITTFPHFDYPKNKHTDMLNMCINSKIAVKHRFVPRYNQDYLFAQECYNEAYSKKHINCILGIHL